MTHPLVAQARKHLGRPYVWGGKGLDLFDAERLVLEPSIWAPEEVFDCSGLVTTCLHELGLRDWRASHSAGTLRDSCAPVKFDALREGDLLFRPRHVAIFVAPGPEGQRHTHATVIEASGGDQSTRSPAAAVKRVPAAMVREHLVSLAPTVFTSAGRLGFFPQGV